MINFDEAVTSTESVEMVELFQLAGRTYTIPKKPRLNIALKYLKMAREETADTAAAYLLSALLGAEAYDALTDVDDLTVEQFQTIVQVAQNAVLGGLEGPKAR